MNCWTEITLPVTVKNLTRFFSSRTCDMKVLRDFFVKNSGTKSTLSGTRDTVGQFRDCPGESVYPTYGEFHFPYTQVTEKHFSLV